MKGNVNSGHSHCENGCVMGNFFIVQLKLKMALREYTHLKKKKKKSKTCKTAGFVEVQTFFATAKTAICLF